MSIHNRIQVRHLVYFLTLADELHFGHAAQRLHIAQPSLSQQIRSLERQLEVELFTRTKRDVQLTWAGKIFLAEARAIVKRTEHSVELLRRAKEGEVGSLRIGFIGSAIYDIVPRLLRAYRAEYPEVIVSLVKLASTWDHVDALRRGEIDTAILRLPVEDSTVDVEVLRQETFHAALPASHRCARAPGRLPVKALAEDDFVTLRRHRGALLYDATIGFCERAGFHPRVVQEVDDLDTVVRIVASGLGVALVPTSVKEVDVEGLVYRDLQDWCPVLQTALAWLATETSPTVLTLRAFARSLFRAT